MKQQFSGTFIKHAIKYLTFLLSFSIPFYKPFSGEKTNKGLSD